MSKGTNLIVLLFLLVFSLSVGVQAGPDVLVSANVSDPETIGLLKELPQQSQLEALPLICQ